MVNKDVGTRKACPVQALGLAQAYSNGSWHTVKPSSALTLCCIGLHQLSTCRR